MRPVLVGISGGSASGKSTLARLMSQQLTDCSCVLINQDHYFRDWSARDDDPSRDELRTANRPEAVHWPALMADLDRILAGEPVELPAPGTRAAARGLTRWHVTASDVVVIEGLFALWDDELRSRCDLTIFVEARDDERALRRMTRDISERGATLERGVEWYRYDVRPSYPRFTEPTRWLADLIVPNVRLDGIPSASVAAVVAAIRALVAARRG